MNAREETGETEAEICVIADRFPDDAKSLPNARAA